MQNKKEYLEGVLYVNENARLAVDEWHELHCGWGVELKLCGKWLKTRIEADNNGEYYAVGLKGLPLVGVKARVRV